MKRDYLELMVASIVSLMIGSGSTYVFVKNKMKPHPTTTQEPAALERPPVEAVHTEGKDTGLTTIQMMKLDPEAFLDKTAKIYGYIKPKDYYNYGYASARDSHFDFEVCEGNGGPTECANFYILKSKGRDLLQKALSVGSDTYFGPVTLIVANLKFRYEKASSDHFELLDYRFDQDFALKASGYTTPDLLTQMGVGITKIETRWQVSDQPNGFPLWMPVVRLYFQNFSDKAISNLELDGKFLEAKGNESFGTGSASLDYNEALEPGQSRFLDVQSKVGYRGSMPYPIPVMKANLVLNKSEIGSVTFSGTELSVTTVKVKPLVNVADTAAQRVAPARTPAAK